MLPSITILGRNVPTYGLCAALGLMLFVLLFKREDKHCPGESADVELGFVYGLLGAALGAKLLFLLTGLPALWADRALLFSDTARFLETYVLSGFVFYGGLYGALCGVLLYGKKAGASGSMLLRACFRPGGLFFDGLLLWTSAPPAGHFLFPIPHSPQRSATSAGAAVWSRTGAASVYMLVQGLPP